MFISNFAISSIVKHMITGLSNKTFGFLISYRVTFSDNIWNSSKVTLVAIFLSLSSLFAILVSFVFSYVLNLFTKICIIH